MNSDAERGAPQLIISARMRALGAALAVLVAAACSVASTAPLRVVRFSGLSPVPALDRSVADGAAAQRLHDQPVSLPVAQNRWCAYGTGAGYEIVFSDTVRRTLVATVEIGGCFEAILHGTDRRRATDDAFWTVFAQTLGLEPGNYDQLFPQPLSFSRRTGSHAPALRDRFAPRRR